MYTSLLTQHPIRLGYGGDLTAIQQWLDEIPSASSSLGSNSTIDRYLFCLSLADKKNFFSNQNFTQWYSDFCGNILEGTINNFDNKTQDQLDLLTKELLNYIIKYRLTSHSMQELVLDIFGRNIEELFPIFLSSLVYSGLLEFNTMVFFSIESSSTYRRWQSFGFAALPTILELESLFLV